MKRTLGFLLLACAMPAFFSCTKEINSGPVEETRDLVFTATREDVTPDTKTQSVEVDGKKYTYWSVGDEISVFYISGTSGGTKFTSTNTEPAASADFSGVLTTVTGGESVAQEYFWAVYPYNQQNSVTVSEGNTLVTTVVPDAQYGTPGTFSDGQNISIARSPGLSLSFKNLLSGFKISVSRNDITRITITGNNGEPLAGTVKVSMDSGVPVVSSVVSGKTTVTLTPAAGGTFSTGVLYYLYFLPTTFENGLTFTFYASDGSVGKRTLTQKIEVVRNNPWTAENADTKATFTSPSYVDMGNGLLFATFNVGASSPTEAGDYFAWGETARKDSYSFDNYKWGTLTGQTKYVFNGDYLSAGGYFDNRFALEAIDDAATKNWGSNWRTPTKTEWATLSDESKYTWTWYADYRSTGVAGYKVTSKSTSNSVFLPAVGGYRLANSLSGRNTTGYYWAATYYSDGTGTGTQATNLKFNSSTIGLVNTEYRRMGFTVRPIYATREHVTDIIITAEEYVKTEGRQDTFSYLLEPEDAFEKGVTFVSNNPEVAKISLTSTENGVTNQYGRHEEATLTTGVAGEATITVTATDGGYTRSFRITVESDATGVSLSKSSHGFGGYPEDSGMAPLQLTATVTPSTASQYVYWSSSDESVATVSADGLVTPVGRGSAVITARKSSSLSASCNVTVDWWEHVTNVSLNGDSYGLTVGGSYSGNQVTISPWNAHDQGIIWSSSDTNVATVSQSGEVHAIKPGIAVISATSRENSDISDEIVVWVATEFDNGYGYVDMGNGIKIAATNVGAARPWDYGDYFMWGETTASSIYRSNQTLITLQAARWSEYTFFNGYDGEGNPIMSKYNSSSTWQLDPSDDVATARWGNSWRMPSNNDLLSLCNNSNVNFDASVNGIPGAMLTSKINGASVFIPYNVQQVRDSGGSFWPYAAEGNGVQAYFWTRGYYYYGNVWEAMCFDIDSKVNGYGDGYHDRDYLKAVRPLYVGN